MLNKIKQMKNLSSCILGNQKIGEKQEIDANTFGIEGKKAYSKLADLGKKRDDLMDAMKEIEVLTSYYHQLIQQTEINPPAQNGEDTSVTMEEANDIAEEATKEE